MDKEERERVRQREKQRERKRQRKKETERKRETENHVLFHDQKHGSINMNSKYERETKCSSLNPKSDPSFNAPSSLLAPVMHLR